VNSGKTPPYNKEAEMAVLGGVLLDNSVLSDIEGILSVDDFYIKNSRRIFRAMLELHSSGIGIDHVTIGGQLEKDGGLAEIGGAITLSSLTDSVATVTNVVHYAGTVRELSAIRKVMSASREAVDCGFKSDAGRLTDAVDGIVEASHYLARTRMPQSIFELGDGVIELYKKVAGGYRGIPMAWPTLDNMTAGMWPGTVTMFVGRPGTGKCERFDTLICCARTGRYKTIEDTVKDHGDVFTRKRNGSIVSVTPDAWLYMGKQGCLRVKLRSGREMSQTPEHPFMTVDGWKRADDLSVGNYVESVGIVPEPEDAIDVSLHEANLIAGALADGGLTHGFCSFTKEDKVVVAAYRDAVCHFGGELVQYKNQPDCQYYAIRTGGRQGHGPNPIREALSGFGCDFVLSKNKTIPDRVFQYSNDSLAKFIGMFWSCDGSFPNANGRVVAEIGLASKGMIDQLQRLLLRFGIQCRVRYKPVKLNDKIFDSWVLSVYSTSFEAFRRSIPITGRKASVAAMLPDSINPNVDNIPITPALKVELLRIVNQFNTDDRVNRYWSMSNALGMATRISVNKLYRRDTVSRRIFCAFIDAFDADHLRHLTVNHWDRVESIEYDGVHDVYDFEVEKTHSFVANDVIVHNTQIAVLSGRHAWLHGSPTLIVSPEMSKEEIAERFFVIDANVSYKDLIHGQLSDFSLPQLESTVERLKSMDGLWIMDSDDDLSPKGIDAAIRACRPSLVAVDSIYDLHVRGERRDRAIIALEWMKRSAKRLDFACCGFAQQNRAAELSEKKGGGARLGTIALADEIGQDAHAVFALEQSKDDKADKIMRIKALKLRRGHITRETVFTNWDFDKMLFDEIPPEDEEFIDDEPIPF